MKTTIKYLMLALVAVLACVSFSACGSDDDDINKGIGNYYFRLYDVESNCVDANGSNVAEALKSTWIQANKADAQGKVQIGKIDKDAAHNFFDQTIQNLVESYSKAYMGNLPAHGYIFLYFSLGSDAQYSGASDNAVIEIRNSGARRL